MERSYVAENETERARLKAIVASLMDADMARPMSEEWTVHAHSGQGGPDVRWKDCIG